MDIRMNLLEAAAVDKRTLATNLPDMPDCTGAGLDVKTEIIDRFPLVNYLLNSSLTQRVRREINQSGMCLVHKDGDGKWVLEVPRELWTLPAESTENECCWQPFDFAKCGGNVPLNLLCLKDCDSIMDSLMGQTVTFGASVPGLASDRDTLNEIKKRVARMSMAFLTAHNVILGSDDTFTDILKPFHGLIQVMENPAIVVINGTNILSAFDSVGCRIALLPGDARYTFAVNPVTYESIKNEIRVGQYGNLPEGWSRDGEEIRFHGISFLRDRMVPVDLASGTGEVWVLENSAVGLYLATDLMPSDAYIKQGAHTTDTYANGCAEDCTYYYNLGSAMGNNANKLMRVVDIPISGACSAVIGTMGALVQPRTLIPAV